MLPLCLGREGLALPEGSQLPLAHVAGPSAHFSRVLGVGGKDWGMGWLTWPTSPVPSPEF